VNLPNGAQVVFDYSDLPVSLSPEQRTDHERRAARVAALGEAWVSHFEKDKLCDRLAALGFSAVQDLGPRQIASLYFPSLADSLTDKGGHIFQAAAF
jgi:O-methyltransferase involved in polyketide biosynthesis